MKKRINLNFKNNFNLNFKNKSVIILFSFFVITLIIGSSYAYFKVTKETDAKQITIAKLDLKFAENAENSININPAIPVPDSYGLNQTPYKFSIENIGTLDAEFKVKLLDVEETHGVSTIPKNLIKYSLNGSEPKTLDTLVDNKLDAGEIKKGDTKQYELRIWLDYSATKEIGGFHYHAKIEATGTTIQLNAYKESKTLVVNSNGKPLENYKIYGDSEQIGDNLFDKSIFGIYGTNDHRYISIKVIKVKKNTNYILISKPNTYDIQPTFTIRGANENPGVLTPNQAWTFGTQISDNVTSFNSREYEYITVRVCDTNEYYGINADYDMALIEGIDGEYIPYNPTVSNPIEVVSVGENSKNLFDSNVWITNGYVKVNEEYIGNTFKQKETIWENKEEIPGQFTLKYSIKYDDDTRQGQRIAIEYTDGSVLIQYPKAYNTWLDVTYVTDSTKTVDKITTDWGSSIVVTHFKNIQLKIGTSATEYRPYRYIDVNSKGKNLFTNESKENYIFPIANKSTCKFESTSNSISAINVSGLNSAVINPSKIKVVNGDSFTMSAQYTGNKKRYLIRGLNENGEIVQSGISNVTYNIYYNAFYVDSISAATFSINSDTVKEIQVGLVFGVDGQVNEKYTYSNIQLEEGSTVTDYEPYQEPVTTTIDLTGHEPLRKIGDISDYIDYKKGKIIRKIGKRIIPKNTKWSEWQDIYNGSRIIMYLLKAFGNYPTLGGFNIGNVNQNISTAPKPLQKSNILYTLIHTAGVVYWYPDWEEMGLSATDDVQTANQKLSTWLNKVNGEIYFTYVLATPTEENIDLPSIPTFDGSTNITLSGLGTVSAMAYKKW